MNRLTNIFKLMSDETRLRMIMLLNREALCVCEISGILNIPAKDIAESFKAQRHESGGRSKKGKIRVLLAEKRR